MNHDPLFFNGECRVAERFSFGLNLLEFNRAAIEIRVVFRRKRKVRDGVFAGLDRQGAGGFRVVEVRVNGVLARGQRGDILVNAEGRVGVGHPAHPALGVAEGLLAVLGMDGCGVLAGKIVPALGDGRLGYNEVGDERLRLDGADVDALPFSVAVFAEVEAEVVVARCQ